MRARSGLAPDLPDRRGHRGRGHDARRICLVLEHFAPIATFRAHEAGEAARTRGEATKRNACATSVAPGVPKGRALGPLAVVTRARTPQSPTLRYTTIFIGKTTSKLSSNRFASLVDPREADSIFRSFSDPLLLYFHSCITIGVELPPPPQNSSAMAEI